jgi:hypothetical protein
MGKPQGCVMNATDNRRVDLEARRAEREARRSPPFAGRDEGALTRYLMAEAYEELRRETKEKETQTGGADEAR